MRDGAQTRRCESMAGFAEWRSTYPPPFGRQVGRPIRRSPALFLGPALAPFRPGRRARGEVSVGRVDELLLFAFIAPSSAAVRRIIARAP